MFSGIDIRKINRIQIRIRFLSLCFFLGFFVLSAKLFYLATISYDSDNRMLKQINHQIERPLIYDRNANLVALNIDISSVAIRPSILSNKDDVIDRLLVAIPNLYREDLENKILNDRKFVWLKRGVTPNERERIHNLGIPGVQFIDETKRFYSAANTLSNVIGYINIDNKGQTGIEKYIDQNFNEEMKEGIHLSMDLEVSHAMRDELLKSMKKYSAKGAAGILMNVDTGEVISMTSLPDFDPHYPKDALKPENINRVTMAVYEIGSTFKAFTAAMALDSGVVDLDTIYDATNPIKIGRHSISDFHAKNRELTVEEIFIYSSNIGAAKMAADFGVDYHKSFLKKLGFMDKIDSELPDPPKNLVPEDKDWKELNTMTISYGHGIAITPLHAAVAGASLVNGGRLINPTFLKKNKNEIINYNQVIDPTTSDKIKKLMYLNVLNGSGGKAAVEGILVGGKTGSAEKYDSDKNLTTFLGAFPINDPEYILFILLDEPEGIEETYGYATAGYNVAPTFSNIVTRIAPMLDIVPSELDTIHDFEQITIASNLNLYN
jgi:cell division protein FtsI (penicillin-binding protein 3)